MVFFQSSKIKKFLFPNVILSLVCCMLNLGLLHYKNNRVILKVEGFYFNHKYGTSIGYYLVIKNVLHV